VILTESGLNNSVGGYWGSTSSDIDWTVSGEYPDDPAGPLGLPIQDYGVHHWAQERWGKVTCSYKDRCIDPAAEPRCEYQYGGSWGHGFDPDKAPIDPDTEPQELKCTPTSMSQCGNVGDQDTARLIP
jgi:hypothetical protein